MKTLAWKCDIACQQKVNFLLVGFACWSPFSSNGFRWKQLANSNLHVSRAKCNSGRGKLFFQHFTLCSNTNIWTNTNTILWTFYNLFKYKSLNKYKHNSLNILHCIQIQIFEQVQTQFLEQFYIVFKYSSNIMCAHRLVDCPTQLTVIFMLFYLSQDK